ncbi:hypothetical protein Tco_0307752 [Tanacetum coccineum]
MITPHPNRRFVPQAVLTRSGKINTAGACVNTAVRQVNTTGSKTTVNHPRPISNAYKKRYSQVTNPFNKYSTNKNSIFNKKVNTVRVKDTSARDRAVVSENKRKGANAVKASACWGNPQQKEYKKKGVIDSGCSRHITGNKCYLTEYEDYDGGFVSFGDGKGRISRKCKIKTGTLDFDNNPVFHSKTKHIEIRHHFIRDSYEKRLIQGRLMVYKCSGLYTSAIWIEVGRLKMLFGPVLRVKHGKKLVSAARLALCCWAKVSTVRHKILDFLTSSSINFALTISPTIYASYIEQFWNTACLKIINLEKQIHANVDGKVVVVSESSVRRDLHLNNDDGTACLTTNEIFENLALMGYEPASDKLTFYKGLFSPQWKYLIHTILHFLSSKSTS